MPIVLTTEEYQQIEANMIKCKETMKQAGYSYIRMSCNGGHILHNNTTGKLELFIKNKNHASWGLKYKNTHLEFACTVKE